MRRKQPEDEKVANIAPFGLRMQPSLKAKVQESALRNNRSVNSEIVARIEQSFLAGLDSIEESALEAIIERVVQRTLDRENR